MIDKNVKAAMYGSSNEPEEISERPLSGKLGLINAMSLEVSGKNHIKLVKGNSSVVLPTASYVAELEKKNALLNRELARMASDIRRLQQAHNGLVKVTNDLKTEMKNKVSKRGE